MMKAGWSGRRWACLPVYMLAVVSLRGHIQNFAHLRRPLDLARVARHPGRRHRGLRDAVEMLRGYFDLAQAARHAEAANEPVEHAASILVRMPHGGGDQQLPLGIG